MVLFFIKNYLLVIILIFVFYILGNLLFRIIKIHFNTIFTQIFFSVFAGLIIAVCTVSIVKTTLNTINIFFIILFFLFLYEIRIIQKKSQLIIISDEKKTFWGVFLILFFTTLLIFTWNFFISAKEFNIPDHIFYGKISSYIYLTGQENLNYVLNIYDSKYHGATPYHYFELWLNSILNLFRLELSLTNIILGTPSILISLFVFGSLSLTEHYKIKSSVGFILAISSIFVSGFILPFFEKWPFINDFIYVSSSLPIHNLSKFSVSYLFLIGFIILWIKGFKNLGLIFILGLSLACFAALPGIIIGYFIFFIFNLFTKWIDLSASKRVFVYYIFLTLGILLFYYFNKTNNVIESTTTKGILNIFTNLLELSNLKTRVNILAGSFIKLGILYLPMVALFFILIKLKLLNFEKEITIVISVFILGGLLAWTISYREPNAVQALYMLLKGFNIISFLLIVLLFKINKEVKLNAIPILLCAYIAVYLFIFNQQVFLKIENLNGASINDSVKNNYLQQISTYLQKNDKACGAYIKSVSDYNDFYSKAQYFSILGGYLSRFNNYSTTISISDFDIPIDSTNLLTIERDLTLVKAGFFYQFVLEQKSKNKFLSIEHSQLDFIKKFKFKFLIVSPTAQVPALLKKYSKTLCTDASGERFIILNINDR